MNQAVEHANMIMGLDPIIGGPDPFDYRFDRSVKPKLSVGARELHQEAPYNKYCFTPSGKQALAGMCSYCGNESSEFF